MFGCYFLTGYWCKNSNRVASVKCSASQTTGTVVRGKWTIDDELVRKVLDERYDDVVVNEWTSAESYVR